MTQDVTTVPPISSMLTMRGAAKELGVSLRCLRDWIRAGRFNATIVTPTKYRYFSRERIEEIKAQMAAAANNIEPSPRPNATQENETEQG